ncbi:hypothetical protein PRNP1_005304 [Phytophthora ramorum]
MVPGNGSLLCAYAPTSPNDAKTISISIRRGSDGRSSSIILPREHHLARHLERLIRPTQPPQPQAQPLDQQPAGHNVVRALSSVVKYIHCNSQHEAPDSSIVALFRSLRPPSDRLNDAPANSMPDGHLTETIASGTPVQRRVHHRRSSNGRTRTTKHCKVLGCGNISVSRGLCRGHGGGRRCHYVGCSKSAQSRSVFCWAHGGGHRCEVESCMRSCKSKRFCADHANLENASVKQTSRMGADPLKLILNDMDDDAPMEMPRNASLPSLQDALRHTQQSSMTL